MKKAKLHRDHLDRYGAGAWAFRAACGTARRVIGFRAFRGMTLEPRNKNPEDLHLPTPFSLRRFAAVELAGREGFADEEGMGAFCEEAALRGDWCDCIMDGDTIASSGWYATGAVPAMDDTWIRFSSRYLYMYKGFTSPAYRGLKLHAYGMGHAAVDAVDNGYLGLISFVEVQNESSLRSVARLGYQIFGTCTQIRVAGRTLTHRTPGCEAYGFELFVPALPSQRIPRADGQATRSTPLGSSRPG